MPYSVATVAGWTRIVDAATQTPVAGVMVFVEGLPFGPSGEDGRLWITAPRGACLVRIVKDTTYNDRRVVSTTTEFPPQLDVSAVPAVARPLTFKTARQTGITLALCSEDGTVFEQNITWDGVMTTVGKYLPGTYVVKATMLGYTEVATTVVVQADLAEYAVRPPLIIGNGSQEGV